MEDSIKRDRFDFEIGYLTKSPCTECEHRNKIPECRENCRVLDEIRTLLAKGISTQASTFYK
ncbi:MAG: hypothetical protein K9J83_06815 [Desulfarculaceae bacterium]|nr:hypothetical protein [Desulfarculaceae bacterium]